MTTSGELRLLIKTVFIDYDDTLHDSRYVFGVRLEGILEIPGERLWDIYLNNIHRGIIHRKYPERHDDEIFHCKLLFKYVNIPFDLKLAKKFLKAYREARVETWTTPRFFSETEFFLQTLKDMKLKLCLTTGDFSKEKAACISRTFRKEFFDYIFDEVKIGFRKLDTEYYVKALIESGSSAFETVCVGDALEMDIGSSKATGVKTIWVNRRGDGVGEIQPDFVARDLNEALKYIIKLNFLYT